MYFLQTYLLYNSKVIIQQLYFITIIKDSLQCTYIY